ncbi:MAG: signal peptidase I [Chloroflexota bacterium]|nr:signal peptidase I [Chloroflexota bacterium]
MKGYIIEIVVTLLIVLLIFFGFQVVVQSYRIDGDSMETSFHDGQYMLVNKLTYRFGSPQRGDVVILQRPENSSAPYIKRVVGMPGEEVEVADGHVYINNELVHEPDYIPTTTGVFHQVVPEDEYFVLGDNRPNSSDSRYWGTIPREDIIGKVWVCYWPPVYFGFSPSYAIELDSGVVLDGSAC